MKSVCRIWTDRRPLTSLVLFFAAALAGCGEPPLDDMAEFDQQVETVWKQKWNFVDGITFLESGGLYADSGDPEDQALDRPSVLPLLKRLKETFDVNVTAVVSKQDAKKAFAMVVPVPIEPEARSQLREFLAKEQDTFPGDISAQWGHQWLQLEFLTREQSDFFADAEKR